MKNYFEEPKMEIIEIELNDIVCESGGGANETGGWIEPESGFY